MSKRSYTQVQKLLPEIKRMKEKGKTHQEIAEYLGLENKSVVKNLLYRERNKHIGGVPKQRGRKPARTLAEYRYENKRLEMENKLLRDFLQYMERK